MIREALLSFMGLRAATSHIVTAPTAYVGDPTHDQRVHDLRNDEAKALAGFELVARRSARINLGNRLGDAAGSLKQEIEGDAERLRAALQAGFKREEDDQDG